jgi:hypothetical protein
MPTYTEIFAILAFFVVWAAWHLNYIHPEKLFFCDYSSLKRVQVRNRTRQQEQIDQQQEEISYYNRIRTENLERELEQARVRARMQEEQLRRFRQQQLQHSRREQQEQRKQRKQRELLARDVLRQRQHEEKRNNERIERERIERERRELLKFKQQKELRDRQQRDQLRRQQHDARVVQENLERERRVLEQRYPMIFSPTSTNQHTNLVKNSHLFTGKFSEGQQVSYVKLGEKVQQATILTVDHANEKYIILLEDKRALSTEEKYLQYSPFDFNMNNNNNINCRDFVGHFGNITK